MKWYLLVALVLLAACSTASPRDMRRQADTLERQADALREDASAEEQRQYEAAMAAATEQAAWLTSIAPTQTPVPTATPTPSATPTPQPTATATELPATATAIPSRTPEMVARAIQATAGPDSPKTQAGPVESEQGSADGAIIVSALVLAVMVLFYWIPKIAKWISRRNNRGTW